MKLVDMLLIICEKFLCQHVHSLLCLLIHIFFNSCYLLETYLISFGFDVLYYYMKIATKGNGWSMPFLFCKSPSLK